MDKDLLKSLIASVGIYFHIVNDKGFSYSNIPEDFNNGELLVLYNERYYNRKIGFTTIDDIRYEITVYTDVTDIKKMSMHDQKTGALNLESFEKNLVEDANASEDVILCMLDIDDFKRINDTFGHHIGDLVLKKVVDVFKEMFTEKDLVCRFGGDEFLFAIKSDNIDEVRNKMDEFAACFRSGMITYDNIGIPVTFSIGVTRYKKDEDYDSNFKDVDDFMYYCKKHGKDAVISKDIKVRILEKN